MAINIAALEELSANNDFYGYWKLLADDINGTDLFPQQQLGVVENNTQAGKIWNAWFQREVYKHYDGWEHPGRYNVTHWRDTWARIQIGLMKADLDLRRDSLDEGSYGALNYNQIKGYHEDIYTDNNLPPEAWAPYVPLETGGDRADKYWELMLNPNWETEVIGTNSASPIERATGHGSRLEFFARPPAVGNGKLRLFEFWAQ